MVRVIADTGETGYGEAPPTAVITGDTLGSIECAVRDFIRPALLGMEIENLDGIMKNFTAASSKTPRPRRRWIWRYTISTKASGRTGPSASGRRPEAGGDRLTISVNPIEEMVADALEAVGRGYRILKIKVGKEGRGDVERIAAIRSAVGPEILLRVDANQGWDARQSVSIISAMEDKGLDIELVEQPVRAHDIGGMKYITWRVQRPPSWPTSRSFPRRRGGDHPPARCGLHQHQAHEDRRHPRGAEDLRRGGDLRVECMIGCMLESRLRGAPPIWPPAGASSPGPTWTAPPCSVDP